MTGFTDDERKHSLLNTLSLDKGEQNKIKTIPKKVAIFVVLVITALVTFYFLATDNVGQVEAQTSKSSASATTDTTQPPPKTAVTSGKQVASKDPLTATTRDAIALSASGYVIARRVATVSAEVTGRIVEVLIEEGMAVEQGQILARLEDDIYYINLRRARANLQLQKSQMQIVKARLLEAQRILQRERNLKQNGFSSEARITSNETQEQTLKAELASQNSVIAIAKLEVSQAHDQLANTIIRAPFTGIIINKAAQQGEIVSPISAGGGFTRTGIGTLVDMDSLEIEVDVNESFIGRVFPNQLARANLDAYPEWDISAKVLAIVPTANRSKATVRVRIAIVTKDNIQSRRILPDMAIKVDFFK